MQRRAAHRPPLSSMSSVNPKTQKLTILAPDGHTPVVISLVNIDAGRLRLANIGISMGHAVRLIPDGPDGVTAFAPAYPTTQTHRCGTLMLARSSRTTYYATNTILSWTADGFLSLLDRQPLCWVAYRYSVSVASLRWTQVCTLLPRRESCRDSTKVSKRWRFSVCLSSRVTLM